MYQFYESWKLPFLPFVFWRRISEQEFRAAIRPHFADTTNLNDAVKILAHSKAMTMRDPSTGRLYRAELL